MQRTIEQRMTAKRPTRRHPRARIFGFNRSQWPFIAVLVGNWAFAILFFALAKMYWHWMPEAWDSVGDRLALVIKG